MNLPVPVYALAALGAFVASALSLPLWSRFCLRTGLVDDPGQRKIHRETVPLAGGLAVLTGVLLPFLLCWIGWAFLPPASASPVSIERVLSLQASFADSDAAADLREHALQLAVILLGAIGMLTVGLLDDKQELRPGAKFAGQLVVAVALAAVGIRITLFVPNVLFSYALTVLWMLTVINAVNFMDNMNGLCGGLGVIGMGCFAGFSAMSGQPAAALLGFIVCGALLGFLPWNFPRARVFLGDSGSHLVGYLLAVMAILPHFYSREHPRRLAVFFPLVVLAVPLADLARVVLLRWRQGRPFYVGDTSHLSHWLVQLGTSPTTAVVVIWLAAALTGIIGFMLLGR